MVQWKPRKLITEYALVVVLYPLGMVWVSAHTAHTIQC